MTSKGQWETVQSRRDQRHRRQEHGTGAPMPTPTPTSRATHTSSTNHTVRHAETLHAESSTDQTLLNEYVQLMCTSNLRETDFNADVLSALLSDDTPLFLALQAVHTFNDTVAATPTPTPAHNRDELLQQVLYETRTRWEEAPYHLAFNELISMRANVDAALYWELFVMCCTGNDTVPLLNPTLCLALYALGSTEALTLVLASFDKVDKGKKNWTLAKRQTTLMNLCTKAASAVAARAAAEKPITPVPISPTAALNVNPAAAPTGTRSPSNGTAAVVSWAVAAGNANSLPAFSSSPAGNNNSSSATSGKTTNTSEPQLTAAEAAGLDANCGRRSFTAEKVAEAQAKLPVLLNDYILTKCEENDNVKKSDFDGTARDALNRMSFLQALQAIEHFAGSVSPRINKRPAYLMGILRGQDQHWDKSRAAAQCKGGSAELLDLDPVALRHMAELCLGGNCLPSDFTPEVCLALQALSPVLAVKAVLAFNSNKRIVAGFRGGIGNRPRFFQRLIQNVAEQADDGVDPPTQKEPQPPPTQVPVDAPLTNDAVVNTINKEPTIETTNKKVSVSKGENNYASIVSAVSSPATTPASTATPDSSVGEVLISEQAAVAAMEVDENENDEMIVRVTRPNLRLDYLEGGDDDDDADSNDVSIQELGALHIKADGTEPLKLNTDDFGDSKLWATGNHRTASATPTVSVSGFSTSVFGAPGGSLSSTSSPDRHDRDNNNNLSSPSHAGSEWGNVDMNSSSSSSPFAISSFTPHALQSPSSASHSRSFPSSPVRQTQSSSSGSYQQSTPSPPDKHSSGNRGGFNAGPKPATASEAGSFPIGSQAVSQRPWTGDANSRSTPTAAAGVITNTWETDTVAVPDLNASARPFAPVFGGGAFGVPSVIDTVAAPDGPSSSTSGFDSDLAIGASSNGLGYMYNTTVTANNNNNNNATTTGSGAGAAAAAVATVADNSVVVDSRYYQGLSAAEAQALSGAMAVQDNAEVAAPHLSTRQVSDLFAMRAEKDRARVFTLQQTVKRLAEAETQLMNQLMEAQTQMSGWQTRWNETRNELDNAHAQSAGQRQTIDMLMQQQQAGQHMYQPQQYYGQTYDQQQQQQPQQYQQ